jgi:hypothetical protein
MTEENEVNLEKAWQILEESLAREAKFTGLDSM